MCYKLHSLLLTSSTSQTDYESVSIRITFGYTLSAFIVTPSALRVGGNIRILICIENNMSKLAIIYSLCNITTMVLVVMPLAVSSKIPIYILGLYPMSGSWPGGEALLPATKLGFQHVNADPRILPGYELVLIDYDTEVRKNNVIVYNNSLIRL